MASRYIYFTRFLPSAERGGGSRRMLQIQEALAGLPGEREVVSTQRLDYLGKDGLRAIDVALDLAGPNAENLLWSETRRRPVSRLRAIAEAWSQTIGALGELSLAILDDPVYFLPLLERLRRLGVPVVAVCHNLETLAPEQVVGDPRRTLLNLELDALSSCGLVITISREETFLLRNLGIPCLFFPYYPTEAVRSRLLRVRERRRSTTKNGVLLLGSAVNPQNSKGMARVLDFWGKSFLPPESGRLIVAGFGTEASPSLAGRRPGVEFLGSLADADLDDLLSRVRSCLCYQENGSGALTRICEMLIAGVPVLANGHAARSYHHWPGVIEFDGLTGLANAVGRLERETIEARCPTPPDASRLAQEVAALMRGAGDRREGAS